MVKIPVAIKIIQDRTGRQTFNELTDVSKLDSFEIKATHKLE